MDSGDRAQSEVIGAVLLLGITIAAVTATVATGSAALGLVTDEARSASVENGMSQLSSQSSLVALGETDARRFDLGSVDGGQLRLDEDAGRVEVRIERPNETETTYNGSIGTLEYVDGDRTVALQGGGVWSSRNGRGQMISPPEYHYRESTLTFPVVRLTGDESTPSSGTGVVRRATSDSGVAETDNPLRNGTVVVEVQSDYYEGWYDFFSQRADGSVTKDDANRTTTARLVVPDEVAFDRAVSLGGGGYTHNSGNGGLDESEYSEGDSHPGIESLIESNVESAADSGANFSDCLDGAACENGTYFASGDVNLENGVDFDTSDGNVTIVVDGDLDIDNNELQVTDSGDNAVKYYVNGSVYASGNGAIGTVNEEIEAYRNQVYVRDGFLEEKPGGGTVDIEAVVYAPNSDTDIGGNVALRGGFAFNSLTTKGSFSVEHDESLLGREITITGGAGQNPITYLHVSENAVEVDFDR
ncbi:archaellin/type IV pilin N-terminal domain-containing protein [Halorubrum sp. SD626R]|uniref:DUF7289 family protein n=1 Tax=Halorubrum sp. SD626R TaxID=1419722 RepID=UPI000AFCEA24|nr:archaellin/type IV pilin N-terminal domain-containing protein [Halorubrum sp. SD626R]TKX82070.1 hypothetical protein EXE53_00215 [Halorubrum sp. SD626R]